MKPTFQLLLTVFVFVAVTAFTTLDPKNNKTSADLNESGYIFDVNVTKINSKYSEIPSAVFRNKLVLVSSKKIGAFGNGIDKNTNQPYTNLFCTDIEKGNIELSTPILFSRILNSKGNEGQVSFSPNQYTIYYTRSERENSANYQLYKARLEYGSYGNWTNHNLLKFSGEDYSVENPHVSTDGKYLYFSSNMEGGFGGFDIYKVSIAIDGTLSDPINLGETINTDNDEKYPHTSKDGKELFFSSKGHNSQGGYDIFISNITQDSIYTSPRNLGIKINSIRDDIAFTLINENKGVFSSNAGNAGQRFNMYKFNAKAIYQDLEGIITEEDGEILPNAIVVLYDSSGKEIERQITGKDAAYSFKIRPFKEYQLKTIKAGYDDAIVEFKSNSTKVNFAFKENLKLSSNGKLAKKK